MLLNGIEPHPQASSGSLGWAPASGLGCFLSPSGGCAHPKGPRRSTSWAVQTQRSLSNEGRGIGP